MCIICELEKAVKRGAGIEVVNVPVGKVSPQLLVDFQQWDRAANKAKMVREEKAAKIRQQYAYGEITLNQVAVHQEEMDEEAEELSKTFKEQRNALFDRLYEELGLDPDDGIKLDQLTGEVTRETDVPIRERGGIH